MRSTINTDVIYSQDSDVGKSEKRFYEDRLRVNKIETKGNLKLTLAVVSDGIGGENAGERAAEMTVNGVFKHCIESTETSVPRLLEYAIAETNKEVFKEATESRTKRNMGATVTVAAIHENRLYIANVGDSRIYLVRGKSITQITVDHSWANEVYRAGKLPLDEAMRHPRKDELMRSIGYEQSVKVDLGLYLNGIKEREEIAKSKQGMQLFPGDKVVLCSDGLIKQIRGLNKHYVESSELLNIVNESTPEQSAKYLVRKALDRETNDNVSAIVLQIPGGRTVVPIKKIARIAVPTLVLCAAVISILVFGFKPKPGIPDATLPPIEYGQVFIANISKLKLLIKNPDKTIIQVNEGDFIDFQENYIIQTGNEAEGYVRLGFPNQASIYLANNTEIELIGRDEEKTSIQINRGRIIVQLPKDYPAKQGFQVISSNNDWAMINGSVMGVFFDPSVPNFYVDCLEGTCYFQKFGKEYPFEEGSHIILSNGTIEDASIGTKNELWLFIPGMIPTPTPTLTHTPTKTATVPARRKTTTATSTRTPEPDEINTNTPLPTSTYTKIPTATPKPTNTPLPTKTLVPTDAPKPTRTPRPSDTPQASNTLIPADTPIPVDTPIPADTPIPVDTPIPPDTPKK